MEHLKVFAGSNERVRQSIIYPQELQALLKIVEVYALQSERGWVSIGESLPPMQISAVKNKLQELLLML